MVDDAPSLAESESQAAIDSGSGGGDLKKMIQRVEGNLIRRIATLEGNLSKISDLEDQQVNFKRDLAKLLNRPEVTQEDIDKWNKNCDKTAELEDLIKQLQRDMESLDGPKIKADILQLFRVQQNFVNKD